MRRAFCGLCVAAAAIYIVAVNGCPRAAEDAFRQGNAALRKRNCDLAIAYYTEALRLKPDYANAYCNRGDAYDEKGDQVKAIADCTKPSG